MNIINYYHLLLFISTIIITNTIFKGVMSVKEMDAFLTSSCQNYIMPVLKSNENALTHFRNNFHSVRNLEYFIFNKSNYLGDKLIIS